MLNPIGAKSPIGGMLDNLKNGIVSSGNNPGRIEDLLVKYMDVVLAKDRIMAGLTKEEITVMFYRYFGSQAFETYDREVDEEKVTLKEFEDDSLPSYMTEAGEEAVEFKDKRVLVRGVRRKLMDFKTIGRILDITPRTARSRFESGRKKIKEN